MAKTFKCRHCKRRTDVNPRLKVRQRYCGLSGCQQARKNQWEREKLKNDDKYRDSRKASKEKWRKEKPGNQYQKIYRSEHPDYVNRNREKQVRRNAKRNASVAGMKIVKTGALNSGLLIPRGLYALFPYKSGTDAKIVKTDALIVELAVIQYNAALHMTNLT